MGLITLFLFGEENELKLYLSNIIFIVWINTLKILKFITKVQLSHKICYESIVKS